MSAKNTYMQVESVVGRAGTTSLIEATQGLNGPTAP